MVHWGGGRLLPAHFAENRRNLPSWAGSGWLPPLPALAENGGDTHGKGSDARQMRHPRQIIPGE